MDKKTADEILDLLKSAYPNACCELCFKTPFQLLVAAMLSAQSTDKTVNSVTQDLFSEYPDAAAFLALTRSELEQKIRRIGIYRNKSRNILSVCSELAQRHGGEVPNDLEQLVSLPGVGRKTANVVLSNAFGVAAIAVDTHVFRVSGRIGLADAGDVGETEQQLMRLISRERWSLAHHLLIWHGRRVCVARSPKCGICTLTPYCSYFINSRRN
jgi:endonuclease-3